MAVLKKIKFGEGENPIQFTEVKPASGGVITAKGTHTDLEDGDNPEYAIDLTIADDGTLVKDNGALKVGTVPAAKVSVDKTNAGIDATDAQSAFKELKNKIDKVGGDAKSYKIVEVEAPKTGNAAEYKIQQKVGSDGAWSDIEGSAVIEIPNDLSLDSVELVTQDGSGKKGQFLKFIYNVADGTKNTVYVDVSSFLTESEFGNGLQVSDAGVVSVKIGSTSEKDSQTTPVDFLTIGADGVKIQGIKAEIDRKIAALDVTTDAAVAGKYVAAIQETDGIVAVKTRANVSDAVLNGYTKGTDATAIAATDSLNTALSKLENQVDKAKAAATTKVVEGTDAGNNMEIVSATSDTDGSTTYTINLTDVASKTALDAEIAARKAVDGQNGQTYAANSSANYIKDATSLNDADVKLDAAIKAVSDKANAIQYQVTGTTLEFYGMTAHA